jgi:hypothetical protein
VTGGNILRERDARATHLYNGAVGLGRHEHGDAIVRVYLHHRAGTRRRGAGADWLVGAFAA